MANNPTFKNLVKDDPLFVKATTYVAHTTYRPGFGRYRKYRQTLPLLRGKYRSANSPPPRPKRSTPRT